MFYNQLPPVEGLPEQALVVQKGEHHPLVTMLDKVGLATVAGTPENNRELWESMSFDDAERFFLWANGVTRGVAAPDRGYADERTTITIGNKDDTALFGYHVQDFPPTTANARKLLREFWDASKGIGDEESATLLGLGVVGAHRLPYGNGRMSRFVYLLRLKGYDSSEEIKTALTSVLANGARFGLNFDPSRADLPQQFASHQTGVICSAYGYSGETPTKISSEPMPWLKDMAPLLGGQEAILRLVEPHFSVPLVTEMLLEAGVSPEGLMDTQGVISAQAVLEQVGLAKFKDIIDKSENLKVTFLRSLIDCLARDDESIYGPRQTIVETYRIGKSGEEVMMRVIAAFANLAIVGNARPMAMDPTILPSPPLVVKAMQQLREKRDRIPQFGRHREQYQRYFAAGALGQARNWGGIKQTPPEEPDVAKPDEQI